MLKILEKGRILLVCDENKTQKTVVRTLENDGYDVEKASTEDQALFILYDETPDLIALDLKMRSSEGMRTFEKIVNHEVWKAVPLLVLNEDPEILKHLDTFTINIVETCSSDPINPTLLCKRVESLLRQKRLEEDLKQSTSKQNAQVQVIQEAENTIQALKAENDKLEKEIENIVVLDSMTGLYNVRASTIRLGEEVARHDRHGLIFSVLFCDLDDLATVNSKYGRLSGDVVIKKSAELLIQGKRQQDYAAHWNGGEFLVILPDTDLEGAIIFADRARKRISNHVFRVNDGTFKVSMTFGVLCYDKPMPTERVVQMVEQAMQKGKKLGKDKVVPAETM